MRNTVICFLTFFVSIEICLAAITGCSNSYENYNPYYSVQLICDNYDSGCTYRRYKYNYYGGHSYNTYDSSSCECYRAMFSNGHNTYVKELKPCSGFRWSETEPDHFPNVEKYDISSNGIEVITSANLKCQSLQELIANNNQLTSISGTIFVGAPNLVKIDFSNNKINGLHNNDFEGASKLTTIDFSHNEITTLDKETFLKLSQLTHLDLSYNSIKTMDENIFRNNKKLQQLKLNTNLIHRIDKNILIPLSNSASVYVSCDNVNEFDGSYLKDNIIFKNGLMLGSENYLSLSNLKYFNISGNQRENTLDIIEYLGLPIETIDVSSNFIRELTANTLKKFINLKYLNLRNTSLTIIDSSTFHPLLFPENNKKLQVLLLNDNPIKRFDTNVFLPMMNDVEVKVSLDHVVEIDTSFIGNLLKMDLNDENEVIFSAINHTFKLYCKIERFKQFTYLNISGNQLANVSQIFEWLGASNETEPSKLVTLDFSHNNISTLDEESFIYSPDLSNINFSHNNIDRLEQNILKGAPKLSTINFSHNNISTLDEELFVNTSDLIMLDLSYNKIKGLRENLLRGATNMTTINFSNNYISIVETGIFTHTPDLASINFANNKLSNLDNEIFSELSEMTNLDLSQNSFKSIDAVMFQNNTKLEYLNLANNPIYRIDESILVLLLNSISVDISPINISEFDSSYLKDNLRFSEGFALRKTSGNYTEFFDQEYLKNLKYFNISGNHLKNASSIIKHLGAPIEILDISSNFLEKLTAYTFESFINLKYLNLRNISLSSIDSDTFFPLLFTKSVRKLNVLLLNDNPIKHFDTNVFSPMMNGVEVQVSCDNVMEIDTSCIGNSLKVDMVNKNEIVFNVITRSFKLNCNKERFNQLTYFNISGNQLQNGAQIIEWLGDSVQSLVLSRNFIGRLNIHTFEKFTNLQTLNLSQTNVSNFGFSTFYHQKGLRSLDLSFNQLKKVNFTLLFRNFQFLHTLRLEGNGLTEINTINRAIFPQLSSLDISRNHFSCDYLAIFLPQRHYTLVVYPTNKTNIDGVDCVHEGEELSKTTPIATATATEIVTTKDLPIVNPSFKNDSSIEIQRTTEHIKLVTSDKFTDQTTETENKPITRFDCSVLSSIMNSEKVQIACDEIEEIDTSCMGTSLQIHLKVGDEIIFHSSQIDFELRFTKQHFQELKYLNISNNQLQNTSQIIALLGPSIEILDVSLNFIGKLDAQLFERFSNLKYLNLSHTNLSNFGFTTFYHQRKIKALDLSYNHLGKVDFSLLMRNFKELNTLNLEGNDLEEINSVTRTNFPKLSTLAISKNNFTCHYLSAFLNLWDHLHLVYNPSKQTNIDGIDCRHKEPVAEFEISSNDKAVLSNNNATTGSNKHDSKTVDSESNSLSADVQELKNLFLSLLLLLCAMCCGYLVVKSKVIQNIRRKLTRNSFDGTMKQQYPQDSSAIELEQRQHKHQ